MENRVRSPEKTTRRKRAKSQAKRKLKRQIRQELKKLRPPPQFRLPVPLQKKHQ